MSILVSDTSVIIDLERGGLLEAAFKLPFGFAVPDALYRNELANYGGEKLLALGLKVETLTPEELTTAARHKQARARLSVPDVYAFALAFHRGWILLAEDGNSAILQQRKSWNFMAFSGFSVNAKSTELWRCRNSLLAWTQSPLIPAAAFPAKTSTSDLPYGEVREHGEHVAREIGRSRAFWRITASSGWRTAPLP